MCHQNHHLLQLQNTHSIYTVNGITKGSFETLFRWYLQLKKAFHVSKALFSYTYALFSSLTYTSSNHI